LKSDIAEGRHDSECTCRSLEHLFVFEIDPDFLEKWGEVSVSFTSGYHESFFERMTAAIKYLFIKDTYFKISDSLIINQKNIDSLKKAVKEIEELAKTKKLI